MAPARRPPSFASQPGWGAQLSHHMLAVVMTCLQSCSQHASCTMPQLSYLCSWPTAQQMGDQHEGVRSPQA